MLVYNCINGGGSVLILATIFSTIFAGEQHFRSKSRTCIPAEAEPILNSSSCYPLENFTRPFCRNHGISLPSYVYNTPQYQSWKNDEGNKDFDGVERFSSFKISAYFDEDITTVRKCLQITATWFCHQYFPSCDGTQSVFMEQKICRESCLELIHICHKAWKMFFKYYTIRFPEERKFLLCELQPYRNAGDSPECRYFNGLANSTDADPEWTGNVDCLYLNGSSYHGNISVTASGIPCQSWTEQCPHRHTMNNTFTELNNAKNYCRNPQNSGQRPWCYTTDRNKRWEYCDVPKCIPVDGSYANWSLNSSCSVSCGKGFETWTRQCNKPEQKYGGKNCSHLGQPAEYRLCLAKPCPADGGYSNWTLSIPCNVSCGVGMEIWLRTCNNPEPKYGGRNCSSLGTRTEIRNCSTKPCPIDGMYSNWTKSSPCSITCGHGVEIWTRQCDNPPGRHGGNCTNRGAAIEIRLCDMELCPAHTHSQIIGISVAATVFVIITAVAYLIFIIRGQRRKKESNNTSEEGTTSFQGTGTSVQYQNLTSEGLPAPGLSRGVVRYRRDYMNTRTARNSWYDRLQSIRPFAIDWLRNAWGKVNELGFPVYDVMQRDRHILHTTSFTYDRLGNFMEDESAKSSVEARSSTTYDKAERPPAVILPSLSECASTTENV